ncbi:unnamed protein product [marine sediment metagenome]|uniref:Transglycosylase SLT domain-containing protein n=1 Tax=marine sediment metagenome TaxID=412755 RepID=X0V143_9ZZZZ
MRPVDRRDIRVAGTGLVDYGQDKEVSEENPRAVPARFREEVLDENPYLEPALTYYGVQEFREALIIVRWRESSNIVAPCKVGTRLERGPFQFMAGTWESTPYATLDPCDLEAATYAAAWFAKEGRQLEWTTWPR